MVDRDRAISITSFRQQGGAMAGDDELREKRKKTKKGDTERKYTVVIVSVIGLILFLAISRQSTEVIQS
jgi:hypothetical protein